MSKGKCVVRVLDPAGDASLPLKVLAELAPDLSTDPIHALQSLEVQPANVLVTMHSFDEMDASGLAKTIKEVDKETNHYTFIILLAEEEGVVDMPPQFDLVYSTKDVGRLLYPAVTTGARLSESINRLKRSNVVLERRCQDFQDTDLIDHLTGLGNERYLEKSLDENITQIESRGGAVCVIYIGIAHFDDLKTSYPEAIVDDLVEQVGNRIKSTIRPLDVITYIGEGQFVLVLNQPSLDDCVPASYSRIYDGVRLKSYRTKAGFLMVKIGMGFCASGAETGPPKPEYLRETALMKMKESFDTESICHERFEP